MIMRTVIVSSPCDMISRVVASHSCYRVNIYCDKTSREDDTVCHEKTGMQYFTPVMIY